MKNKNFHEISINDLKKIDGGTYEKEYQMGYAAGEYVGKMVNNFLVLCGVAALFALKFKIKTYQRNIVV